MGSKLDTRRLIKFQCSKEIQANRSTGAEMSNPLRRYLEEYDEGIVENERRKRESNPDLYDCALAVYEYDYPEFLAAQISQGSVDVNAETPRTDQPLLFLALVKDRLTRCKLLIEAGARLDHQENKKNYLFWSIFANASPDLVKLILSHQGELAEPGDPPEELIDLAIRRSSRAVVKLLIAHFGLTDYPYQ